MRENSDYMVCRAHILMQALKYIHSVYLQSSKVADAKAVEERHCYLSLVSTTIFVSF